MAPEDSIAGVDVAAVTGWLGERVGDLCPPLAVTLVAGGHSCLTYLVDEAGAVTGGRRFVLRRPPLGEVLATAHDVAREHRIIKALAPTDVPVAPVVGVCTDATVIGAPFYVMDFVPGVVLHDATDALRMPVEARRRAGESLVDVLVALHRVDPDAVGLGDLAKRTDYIGRQLRRWSAQWEASKTEDLPGMARLHRWLEDQRPPEAAAGVVHGDFRLGNAIHAPDGMVVAMLDWELCTLGDPMADLSYLLRAWVEPGERARASSEAPTLAGGFPTRAEVVERYRQGSGRSVDDLSYWTAFHAWRSACIVAGVYARYLTGKMGDPTEDISRFERSVVEGMEAGLDAAGLV